MIKTEIPSPASTETAVRTLSGRIQEARSELKPQLQDAWNGAVQAAEAQANIWGMKAGRAAVMAAFGAVGLGLLVALLVCGFVLLDDALHYALWQPGAPWISPVVRGGAYFLVPMLVFFMIWHIGVGYGGAEEESPSATRKS